jgi:DNA-binding NarL/FixJ family response regulator
MTTLALMRSLYSPTTPPRPPATLSDLTPRQISVASMVARAYPDKLIAHELSMSPRAVQYYIESIAYLCQCDPTLNQRVQIANWYRTLIDLPAAS